MLKRVRRRVQEDGPTAELEAFLATKRRPPGSAGEAVEV